MHVVERFVLCPVDGRVFGVVFKTLKCTVPVFSL